MAGGWRLAVSGWQRPVASAWRLAVSGQRPAASYWPLQGIGSRQHLAGSILVVSQGCSGGAQRPHGDHIYLIQLEFQGKLEVRKFGPFFLYACGNVVDLPHVAKRAFGDQVGLCEEQDMRFGSPLMGLFFSDFIFLSFTIFRGTHGVPRGLCAAGILLIVYYFAISTAPGGLNLAWVPGKALILSLLVLYGRYGLFLQVPTFFRYTEIRHPVQISGFSCI